MHYPLYKRIKILLEQQLPDPEPIIVGVSGGADSRYLLYCLHNYWSENNRDPTLLHILSCDHNTRQSTAQEIDLVESYAYPHSFHRTLYTGTESDEHHLRTRRHKQYITYADQYNSTKIFLGHHLDDRIETSILHSLRGCGTTGRKGIGVRDDHFLDPNRQIIRPLIHTSKQQIVDECHTLNLVYITDPTNTDPSYSIRNHMRIVLAEHFNTPGRYTSMEHLYTTLESLSVPHTDHITDTLTDTNGKQYTIQQIDKGYRTTIASGERTESLLYQLYQYLKITIQPRSTTLATLCNNLNTKSNNTITYHNIRIQSTSCGSRISIVL